VISIKSSAEIEKMRAANKIVGDLLDYLEGVLRAGMSTKEINKISREFILDAGAKPAFKGYSVPGLPPFPGDVCTSVNDAIVHGIPSKKTILRDGDIIGVDVGTYLNGFYGDAARTYAVGEISAKDKRLMKITKEALDTAVALARNGNRVGDLSAAIEKVAAKNGYFPADYLTGHGIGRALHEDPSIPNIGRKGTGARLKSGMTLAIEPMFNEGTNKIIENGWECLVADGSRSAHFEYTILVTDDEAEILTIG